MLLIEKTQEFSRAPSALRKEAAGAMRAKSPVRKAAPEVGAFFETPPAEELNEIGLGGAISGMLTSYARRHAAALGLNPNTSRFPGRVLGFHPVFRISPRGQLLVELVGLQSERFLVGARRGAGAAPAEFRPRVRPQRPRPRVDEREQLQPAHRHEHELFSHPQRGTQMSTTKKAKKSAKKSAAKKQGGAKKSAKKSAKKGAKKTQAAVVALPLKTIDRKHVKVRMYNVGFGDAFLLVIPHKERARKVLIDCGVHSSGPNVKHSINEMARQIVADVTEADGVPRIDVVICTHRHQDHVSGFRDSTIWEPVEVEEVWMPWTEDPKDPDARKIRETQSKTAKHLHAALTDKVRRLGAAGGSTRQLSALAELKELVENSLTNAEAMHTLHEGFTGDPRRRRSRPASPST